MKTNTPSLFEGSRLNPYLPASDWEWQIDQTVFAMRFLNFTERYQKANLHC